ncbi:MAG: EamA family transporter [Anaerovoracaceae bacterium]|nr:EamA family transporter [Anaerovoracaceae bacterium]
MFSYVWPITLVVLSNIIYQICAKSLPAEINPLASLTITYLVAAASSAILYFALTKNPDIIHEYSKLNWVPFTFGLVLVGLEVGFIYAYKAGWPVSTASVVQSSFLAVALIIVGFLLYHETITWNKIAGVVICLIGLGLINYR